MRFGVWCLVVSAILAAPLRAPAEEIVRPVSSTPTDPTEFGSLRLEPFESVAPPEGVWAILVTASYFNQWDGTWHTRRAHEDFGRRGEPIVDEELHALERAFPQDDIYRFDVEGTRFDLLLARGFRNGVSVQARVPWIEIGRPRWDGAAEAFHAVFPVVDHYARDLFPRGQTFLYLRAGGRSLVRRDELARSGIGDVALSVGIPMHRTARSAQRLAVTIELPTGNGDSLHGSGGWDAGARWFYTRQGKRNHLLVGAGYTHQDRRGSFLGFERADTSHLTVDLLRPLTPRTTLHLGGRVDGSPLAGLTNLNVSRPAFFYKIGAQWDVGHDQWVAVDIGEEIAPQVGLDVDFSLHLSWGYHP
ncbi:MAG: DUF3187 family protein [Thermoanaerobaculia bacterium]